MDRATRAVWCARERGFARFRAWEESRARGLGDAERRRAIRFALAAFETWFAALPPRRRRPGVDMEKVRGIQETRRALARVRFAR